MKRLGNAASLHEDNLAELIGLRVIFVTFAYQRMTREATA
jgi:hypothetical protein